MFSDSGLFLYCLSWLLYIAKQENLKWAVWGHAVVQIKLPSFAQCLENCWRTERAGYSVIADSHFMRLLGFLFFFCFGLFFVGLGVGWDVKVVLWKHAKGWGLMLQGLLFSLIFFCCVCICMCVHVYMYVYTHTHMCIYTHAYAGIFSLVLFCSTVNMIWKCLSLKQVFIVLVLLPIVLGASWCKTLREHLQRLFVTSPSPDSGPVDICCC